ncbi:hypothetical protein D1BOALGB6SA_10342 [Olavius sp. associated proteobacterium Delta 1]|nr:hypothetical protein D1BOALGB6SA_10342 [Olavius sp. associated proteobacterium Delta 1]
MLNIDDKLKLLRPVVGPDKAEALRKLYYMEDTAKERTEVELKIDSLISSRAKTDIDNIVLLPPPDENGSDGEISLGLVEYLERKLFPYSLRLKDINRHAGIFGSTGTGKTTIATNIIRELHKRKVPTIVIDWETSYRGLAQELKDFIVYTVGIDINPFYTNLFNVPPGISIHEYAKNLVSLVSHDYLGGQGSDTVLLEYILEAFAENNKPIFEDLINIIDREIIQKLKFKGKLAGRTGLWKETVLRQNKFMSIGCIGRVVNTNRHIPVENLLDKWAVLELGNLKSPQDRAFITHFVLDQLMLYFQHKGIVSEKLKLVIVMEEFHNLVNIDGKRTDGTPILIDNMFREIRKYGVGLIAIDQTPSEIPNAVYANMNTKISFSLNTNQDTYSMGRAMNMPELKWPYLGMLETGQAITSIKQRIPEPILLSIPFTKPLPNINNSTLRSLMSGVSDLSIEIIEKETELNDPQSSLTNYTPPSAAAPDKLEALELIFLEDLIKYPFDGVDKRTKRMGMHQTEITKIHKSLTKKQVAFPVIVDGRKLFKLTPYGKEAAERHGLKIPKWKGGIVHAYCVAKVMAHMRLQGLGAAKEVDNIDIIDKKNLIGIEVETGKSNILKNLKKLHDAKLKYKYVLGTDTEATLKVRGISDFIKGIKIMAVKDFMKLTKDQIISSIRQDKSSSQQ